MGCSEEGMKEECDNHFMMYLCWIIMLYTLNLYSAVCQLYPNKTGYLNFISFSEYPCDTQICLNITKILFDTSGTFDFGGFNPSKYGSGKGGEL